MRAGAGRATEGHKKLSGQSDEANSAFTVGKAYCKARLWTGPTCGACHVYSVISYQDDEICV